MRSRGKVFGFVCTFVAACLVFFMLYTTSNAYSQVYNVGSDGGQSYDWTVPSSGYYQFGVSGSAAAKSKSEATSKGTHGGNGGTVTVNEFLNEGDQVKIYVGKKGNGGASGDSQFRGGEYSYVQVNGNYLAVAGGGGGAGRTTDGFDGGEYVNTSASYDTNKYRDVMAGEDSRGDGLGSSGGSGSHGGNAGENTLHEHTDDCYEDVWEDSGGGGLHYIDIDGGDDIFWNNPGATSEQVGAEVDVSDRRELKITADSGFEYGNGIWGYNALNMLSDQQRFWLTDQDGNVIWEIADFAQWMKENCLIISADDKDPRTGRNWIDWPNVDAERTTDNEMRNIISDGYGRATSYAIAISPENYVVTCPGYSYQTYDNTGTTFGEWHGVAESVRLKNTFYVDLPEGTRTVRLHYRITMNFGDPDYNPDDPDFDPSKWPSDFTNGVWCGYEFNDFYWKKKICEYSHEPGGSMGENLGAYGGTSSTYSGVYVSSSQGTNSGNGSIRVDELPLDIIVKYAAGDSESGHMDDTELSGKLSETNVTLSPNQYAKRGYTFMGWSLESGGTVAVGDGSSINISKSPYAGYLDHSEYGKVILTLYPVFEVNSYKLYFSVPEPRNSDGDSVTDRVVSVFDGFDYDSDMGMYYKEVTCFEQIGSLPDLSLVGWDFDGWLLENKRKIVSTDIWNWESSYEVTP